MDILEKAKGGIRMFELGKQAELALFMKSLKENDPLAFSFLEVAISVSRDMPTEAIKKATRLLTKVTDKPEVARDLFAYLGNAYRDTGEMETSDNYYIRVMEISEQIGDMYSAYKARMLLIENMLIRGDYESFYRELMRHRKGWLIEEYYLALYALVTGKFERCLSGLTTYFKKKKKDSFYLSVLEVKGLALRFTGRLDEAAETFIESAKELQAMGVAYALFPLAKALNLARFTGTKAPPPDLIKKCLSLARKGGKGEQAALLEAEALLLDDDEKIAEKLFEAAQEYRQAYQNIEAYLAALSSAYLAWQNDNPVFLRAIKFLATLVPMHPVFRKDPILGKFVIRIEPLLNDPDYSAIEGGIKAYLIENLRVNVNGSEIKPLEWRSRKAAMFFIYLLLSPRHRIAADHLFYLLWPKKRFNKKNRELLFQAASFSRRMVGIPSLIIHKHDFYQLRDTWTDLSEIENLVLRAESSHYQAEKSDLISRARDLANGELLPELPYDRYIDEYREYYRRLRKRLWGDVSLAQSGG